MTKGRDGRRKRPDLDDFVDFTHYSPNPTFEDEFFGGFRPIGRGFERAHGIPKGWADDGLWGLVDGQTPQIYEFLKKHGRWDLEKPPRQPKKAERKIKWQRAKGNEIIFPFARQLAKLAEQTLPEVDPERERAEERAIALEARLERLECLTALKEAGRIDEVDPDDRLFTSYRILHEERAQLYAQHTERRVQAHLCRRFKPSKKLELKRFPTLKGIEAKPGLTKSYLDRQRWEERIAARQESERRVAEFFAAGKRIQVCPPELTAAQAARIKPKMGRPTINDQPMTPAERQRRRRAKQPNARPLTSVARPALSVPGPNGPTVPVNPFIEIEHMITLLERDLAGEYHARLGEILDRLAVAPPDYILSQEEFTIVAAAAVLHDHLSPERRSPAKFN